MTFSVTVLGSSSAIPTLTRNPSAHLLNANERLFLLDCAEGTQVQLRRLKIHLQRIRHIFITHLHGDHFYGLIGLLTTLHLLGRKDTMHIYAHPQLEEIIRIQLEASATTLQYPVQYHPLDFGGLMLIHEDERISVHSFPLKHSVPTCGFLFREKIRIRKQESTRAYAYCTDTVYDESIIPYIQGVDLLYHETTFMQSMARNAAEKLHSTSIEAATIAQKAQVKKLLIGHYSARYDEVEPLLQEARSVFPEPYPAQHGITVEV